MSNPFYVDNGRLIYSYNGKDVGAVYREVDGYYVFAPDGTGAWEGAWLIAIGELLNDLNAEWDREIIEYFRREDESQR